MRIGESFLIQSLKNDFNETKKDINEIKLKLTEMGELSKNIANLNQTIENLNRNILELKEENKRKDIKIESLEEKINILEQNTLEKNIEIRNVNSSEPPVKVVLDLASKINANISEADIQDAYKLSRTGKIIVKFNTMHAKKEYITKCKKIKIKSCDLPSQNASYADTANSSKLIFVHDELTNFNKKLLWMAKTEGRSKNWKFIWVKFGKILAKKNENERPVRITKESDLSLIQ